MFTVGVHIWRFGSTKIMEINSLKRDEMESMMRYSEQVYAKTIV